MKFEEVTLIFSGQRPQLYSFNGINGAIDT